MQIEMMHEDDFVLRKSAGLVGAQDIHRAEVLDRIEALDDDPLARHRDGALARLTVTIIGNISGVNPTATASANISASSQSPFVIPLMTNTLGTITTIKRIISQVKRVTPRSKLVGARCRIAIPASSPK